MNRRALKERARVVLAFAFYYGGAVRVAYAWKSRRPPRLTILCYHRASGGQLRAQMRYLRRHYRIMPLEGALRELYGTETHRTYRTPMLSFTFDDAYADIYTHAFRYAYDLGIPITIFPIVDYANSGECFWWLAPERLVCQTRLDSVSLEGTEYSLRNPSDRAFLRDALIERLTDAPSVKERERFLQAAEQALEVPRPRRGDSDRREPDLPANWTELRELAASEWVSFGAHTLGHPVLARLADDSDLRLEVEEPRRVLEERLGHPISTFAYPIGKQSDIGETAIAVVREAGYSWAVTTIEGVNTPETDPYLLRRLPGNPATHPLVLVSELAGLLGVLSRVRRSFRKKMQRAEAVHVETLDATASA